MGDDVPTAARLAKLRWRARRGMRELDAVLQSFAQNVAATLSPSELVRFEEILDLPDPELFAYLTGRSAPSDPDTARLIDRVRDNHRPAT
jgi:antitoxin CptB